MRLRETPKCPICGETIAKSINRKTNPYIPVRYGEDLFSNFEYDKKHKCKKANKQN